jgi:hypothetical protein
VAAVPDANGDGKGEVAVSDWQAHSETGRVQLFDGATGTHLRTLSSGRDRPADQFGRFVAGLNDVNGNGHGDVLVGASGARLAYIIDGGTGSLLHILRSRALPSTAGFGWTGSSVPDLTGDGKDDVVVGGFPSFGTTTTAEVFDGANGNQIATLPGQSDFGGGGSVAGIPDLNGDGMGEIFVAHSLATSTNGYREAGQASLFLSLSLGETEPRFARQGDDLIVTWQAGIYERLEASADGKVWNEIPGVDPMSTNSFTEPIGARGPTTLFRLGRD